ncbi:peptidase inhibitor family I36 protein [Streptomyces sp. NPDC052114]|uniref:peptidase inhibitor family I36 protein n=1 Tax=unclassified Streptomyces TaxID=2593676 RepID=UPI003430FFA3
MRFTAKIATSTAAVAMMAGTFAGVSSAQESPSTGAPRGARATLGSDSIDLGTSWRGADVCEVGTSGKVRCWDGDTADTPAEKAAFAKRYKCEKGWVCLYDKANLKGRMLRFNDGGWNNLGPYGFNNKTSSVWNRQSGIASRAWFSTKSSGKGKQWYYDPGKVKKMGKYSNKANSVYP